MSREISIVGAITALGVMVGMGMALSGVWGLVYKRDFGASIPVEGRVADIKVMRSGRRSDDLSYEVTFSYLVNHTHHSARITRQASLLAYTEAAVGREAQRKFPVGHIKRIYISSKDYSMVETYDVARDLKPIVLLISGGALFLVCGSVILIRRRHELN